MATTHELHSVNATARTVADEELMTAAETAQFLKVPVTWVYEHVRPDIEDRLPAVKLGKYLRFHRRDLLAYVESKRAAAQNPRRRR